MRIGIICAGDEELAPFLPLINNCKITEKAMLKFYAGQIEGAEVVALFSGVCKVNATIAAQLLIEVCYHDVAPDILTEFHPWMKSVFFTADPRLINLSKAAVDKLMPSEKVVWGRMVSGEPFITDDGRQKICNKFAPLTVDMETAGIAHVCYVNGIPFIAIRCVTDTAEHSGIGNFDENCAEASAIAKDITVALLREIRKSW